MAVFPQMLTGALAQYSFQKELHGRANLVRAADANTYGASDAAARRVRWALQFAGLSETEFAALENLFEASEGRLKNFTFLDPAANLLGWSEDLATVAWPRDLALTLGTGVTGPMGSDGFSLTNTSGTWAEIAQTVAGPAGFAYAFSVWAKGSGTVRLRRFAGAASSELVFELTPDWRRIEIGGALAAAGTGVSFAVGVPAGGAVDVAGPMVEAQLVAGEYKRSPGRGGVYANARFDEDRLVSVAQAADWVDARVRIEARYED